MALDPQHEHAVAAAGPLIGQGLGPGAVLPRSLDNVLDLVLVGDLLNLQVGHVDIGALGVTHLDLILEPVLVVEQIPDLLVVDLEEGCLDRRKWFEVGVGVELHLH